MIDYIPQMIAWVGAGLLVACGASSSHLERKRHRRRVEDHSRAMTHLAQELATQRLAAARVEAAAVTVVRRLNQIGLTSDHAGLAVAVLVLSDALSLDTPPAAMPEHRTTPVAIELETDLIDFFRQRPSVRPPRDEESGTHPHAPEDARCSHTCLRCGCSSDERVTTCPECAHSQWGPLFVGESRQDHSAWPPPTAQPWTLADKRGTS